MDAAYTGMARLILVRLTNLVHRRYKKYSSYHRVTIKGQVLRRFRKKKDPELVFYAHQITPSRLRPMSCNDMVEIHGVYYYFSCHKQGYQFHGQIIFMADKIEVTYRDQTASVDLADPGCIDKVIAVFKRELPVSDPACPQRLISPQRPKPSCSTR